MSEKNRTSEGSRSVEQELSEALAERDRALAALAEARAELVAMRLRAAYPDEPPPGAWVSEGSAALPLRYRIADAMNGTLKSLMGPLHRRVRGAVQKSRRRGR